jgi:hypothetical protein
VNAIKANVVQSKQKIFQLIYLLIKDIKKGRIKDQSYLGVPQLKSLAKKKANRI